MFTNTAARGIHRAVSKEDGCIRFGLWRTGGGVTEQGISEREREREREEEESCTGEIPRTEQTTSHGSIFSLPFTPLCT